VLAARFSLTVIITCSDPCSLKSHAYPLFTDLQSFDKRRLLLSRHLSLIYRGAIRVDSRGLAARAVCYETVAYHVESSALETLARGVLLFKVCLEGIWRYALHYCS
jgi:hypothetical protein